MYTVSRIRRERILRNGWVDSILTMATRIRHPLAFQPGGFGSDVLPDIVWAGFNTWTRRQPQNLGRHAHEHAWEIHFLVRGQIDEWISDRSHIVRSNDLFVMAPGHEHSGMDVVLHRCDMCWLAVTLTPESLRGLDAGERASLIETFASIRPVPFQAEEGLLPAFAGLLSEGLGRREQAASICRAHVHRILFGVARSWAAFTRDRPSAGAYTKPIANAVDLLRERLAAPVRVDALARAVGMSRSVFSERFVAETGMSPAEFLAQARIDRAKAMLPRSNNTEIAFALGFASVQHFGTVFKRHTGLTPGAWRRRPPPAGESPN